MKNLKYLFLLTALSSLCSAEKLQVYLPREITIGSTTPTLGQVAIIRGNDSLAPVAEQISLGQFASPGQKITLDRSVILGRLVSSGIHASEIDISGAKEVTISQQHQIIKGEKFLEMAIAHLTQNPPHSSVCKYIALRTPPDLILKESNDEIRFDAKTSQTNIKNQAKVIVTAYCGTEEAGTREIIFSLKYNCQKVVAAVDMTAGTIISSENIRVENIISSNPQPANWTVPYGLTVRRPVPANAEITMETVEPLKPQIILKRNQNVLIKVDRLGLLVTAMGRTLQEGRTGDFIKVQNLSSQRVILAKVNEDGSVEPVF